MSSVKLGKKNKKNTSGVAGGPQQSKIIIIKEDGGEMTRKWWSGWNCWQLEDGSWYHLGGNTANPVIYKMRLPTSRLPLGWEKTGVKHVYPDPEGKAREMYEEILTRKKRNTKGEIE